MKKYLLIRLMFTILLMTPIISGVTQINVVTDIGIDVSFPQYEIIQKDTGFIMDIYAFNSTTGKILTGVDTDCRLSIYNSTGSQICNNKLKFHNEYFSLNITAGNFSETGLHSYIIRCNTSDIGGFASGVFVITGTGNANISSGQGIIYAILITMFVFFFVLSVYVSGRISIGNNKDESGNIISINNLKYLKMTLWFISYLLLLVVLFLSSSIAFSYLNEKGLGDVLFIMYRVLFLMLLPIVILWFIYVFYSIFKDNEFKRMIDRGVNFGGSTP